MPSLLEAFEQLKTHGIGADEQLSEMIVEASSEQVAAFLAQPGCMETLTMANYYNATVATLDAFDAILEQEAASGKDD